MNKETELLKNYLEMCRRSGCINCPLLSKAKDGCTNYVLSHLDEATEAINNWAENQKKKTGWERVEPGKRYYVFGACSIEEGGHKGDDDFYQKAEYFTSQKLAESIGKFQTICRKIFRWVAENDPNPVTKEDKFNTRKDKYRIEYNCSDECFAAYPCFYFFGNFFVLSNEKTANDLVETFKEELTWLFTEFEFFDGGEIND